MFFAGPDVDEAESGEFFPRDGGLHQHGGIVGVAGEQMFQNFGHRQLGSFAKLGERFIVGKRATLATAQVIAGEKRAFGTGKGFEDRTHRSVGGKVGRLHGGTIAARLAMARRDFRLFSIGRPWNKLPPCRGNAILTNRKSISCRT